MDSFKHVYTQSLGDFDYSGYEDTYQPELYWCFFFFSTVCLAMTLLNQLIAIMGDTFDRVTEVSKESKTKEICSILHEF